MTPLERILIDRIARDGPMPFAAYMSLALYHPEHGYYGAGSVRTGWGGHFVTSPELDPAYAELWVNGIEELWVELGEPPAFEVLEVGPGEGGFAHAFLSHVHRAAGVTGRFAQALSYRLIERVPEVRARQEAKLGAFEDVRWSASLTEVTRSAAGCVFANEVLDNLPVHLVEMRDGHLRELCVDAAGRGLRFVSLPPTTNQVEDHLSRIGVVLEEGQRFEVRLSTEAFVGRAASLFQTGAAVFVDYGASADDLARRPAGTLACYSAAGADDEPLAGPGTKDITCHADWTTVSRACATAGLEVHGPRSQRVVLAALGWVERDRQLRAEHDAAIAAGEGSRAVRALSRRNALAALRDRGGLGGLDVVVAAPPHLPVRFMTQEAGSRTA